MLYQIDVLVDIVAGKEASEGDGREWFLLLLERTTAMRRVAAASTKNGVRMSWWRTKKSEDQRFRGTNSLARVQSSDIGGHSFHDRRLTRFHSILGLATTGHNTSK